MALITYLDVQDKLNIDLTNPAGQTIATDLITAAVGFAEGRAGYNLESGERVTYFDDGYSHLWMPTRAPVSALTLFTYNSLTADYDAVDDAYVRFSATGEVSCLNGLPAGFQAVKAAYTSGWTSENLPADLKSALIDLVGIKLQEVSNFSSTTTTTDDSGNESTTTPVGTLKKVQTAEGYSEEYSTAQSDAYWKAQAAQLSRTIGDDVPAGILAAIDRYKLVFAL